MYVRELELDEFRSFRDLRLSVDPAGFRAVGPNASGKSTLLEAVAMLSTMRSPRTAAEREVVNWQSGLDLGVPPYARARAVFARSDGIHTIELGLSYDDASARSRKLVRFDGRPARAVDAVGQLKTVLFTPEDVELLAGPPSARRRFLDVAIGQASRDYLRALSRFGRVLEQRNSLLRSFAGGRGEARRPGEELAFWDSELTAAAAEVVAFRLGAVRAVAQRARMHYAALNGSGTLTVTYASHRGVVPRDRTWEPAWEPGQEDRQRMAAAFAGALAAVKGEELRRGVTAIGPHRDDFKVVAEDVDLGRYGSRGQQRLAVIALKLAELDFLTEAAGEPPVLLLDDVLSELDARHRSLMIAALAERRTQVILTAADEEDFGSSELGRLPLLRISNGTAEAHAAS